MQQQRAMRFYVGLFLSALIPFAKSRTLSCVGPVYRADDASFSVSCAAENFLGYDLAFTSCVVRRRHEYCRLVRVWEGASSGKSDDIGIQ